jgi:hypothetical protein
MPKVQRLAEKLEIRLESDVKKKVSAYLDSLPCYWRMPVPFGYGKPGLDYEGCLYGWFFAIETKAPGFWLTPRQRGTAREMLRSGGAVFVISGDKGLDAFKRWVHKCQTVSAEHAANQ